MRNTDTARARTIHLERMGSPTRFVHSLIKDSNIASSPVAGMEDMDMTFGVEGAGTTRTYRGEVTRTMIGKEVVESWEKMDWREGEVMSTAVSAGCWDG